MLLGELSYMLSIMKNENKAGVSCCLQGRLLTPGSGDQGSSYLRRLNYSTSVDIYDSLREVWSHREARGPEAVCLDPSLLFRLSQLWAVDARARVVQSKGLGITAEHFTLKRVKERYSRWEGKPLLLFHTSSSSFLSCFWSSCGIHHFSGLQQAGFLPVTKEDAAFALWLQWLFWSWSPANKHMSQHLARVHFSRHVGLNCGFCISVWFFL